MEEIKKHNEVIANRQRHLENIHANDKSNLRTTLQN